MQKTVLVLISLVLAASLVLASPGTAQAFDWTAPVVTPVSGDSEFSATPTSIANLPGILTSDSGLILPAGFPEGSAQFGGDAVVVKDLIQGSAAKVCYSMPAKRTQWEGSVFQWDGSKWARLATTVNYGDEETATGIACTEIYGDGTYALIMGYTGKPEPKGLPVCTDLNLIGWGYSITPPSYPDNPYGKLMQFIFLLQLNVTLPVGTPVSYTLFNFTPPDILQGALNRTATSTIRSPFIGSMIYFPYTPDTFPLTEYLISDQYLGEIPFTVRITLPNCYKDFPNPFHFSSPPPI